MKTACHWSVWKFPRGQWSNSIGRLTALDSLSFASISEYLQFVTIAIFQRNYFPGIRNGLHFDTTTVDSLPQRRGTFPRFIKREILNDLG